MHCYFPSKIYLHFIGYFLNLESKQCRGPKFNPLGWEDPLKKGMATHSSILACLENPMGREA